MKITANKFAWYSFLAFSVGVTLFLLVSAANAQTTNPITIQKDVVTSSAKGVFGTEEIVSDFYIPSINPKGIILWEHGGGFIQGDKGDGNAVLCKFWAARGWLVINTNYRLANLFSIIGADSITATKLFWEAAYRSIEDGKAAVRYAYQHSDIYKVKSDMPVYSGGISAGAVQADLAIVWEKEEYSSLVDTMKWRNRSNQGASVNYAGSISFSGAVFLKSDIDKTDKVMIRCYGLLDKTLKCWGGENHGCVYTGDCQIASMQNDFGNKDFTLVFPNAGHGFKEGVANIIGKANMKKARQFALDTINSL